MPQSGECRCVSRCPSQISRLLVTSCRGGSSAPDLYAASIQHENGDAYKAVHTSDKEYKQSATARRAPVRTSCLGKIQKVSNKSSDRGNHVRYDAKARTLVVCFIDRNH